MALFDDGSVLARAYEDIQRRFAHYHDLAHGWDHVRRVYALALYIAEREHADRFIVGMAALLHDLGRVVESNHNGAQHHADLSLSLAREFLEVYGVPTEAQEAIEHAILAHSFSKGIEARTLEARVVRDADRLDALGAIGIMRWGIVGEQRHRPGLQPYCPDDPLAEHHEPDDEHYMLDHFYVKLLKLEEKMCTETGRRIAAHRAQFMRHYLEEFKQELDVSHAVNCSMMDC